MAVVALVALVVIGPKDLPGAMRTVGHWVRKIRLMARDFQSNLDDMIRESELDDARKAVESTKSLKDPSKALKDSIDPTGEVEKEAKDLEDEGRRLTTDAKNPGRLSEKPREEKKAEAAETKAEAPAGDKKAGDAKAGGAKPASGGTESAKKTAEPAKESKAETANASQKSA